MEYEDVKLFYDILHNPEKYISVFHKKKRSSKGRVKYREIIAPNEDYKYIQSKIYRYFIDENPLPIHDTSYAWINGRSRDRCANMHIDNKYVLEIDIDDFFGNITKDKVEALFIKNNIDNILGLPIDDIINILLIRYKDRKRHLAQGFITSTYIANAARYEIDIDVNRLCIEKGLTYTNYGDNIVISGNFLDRDLTSSVIDIISKHGYSANPRKTKFMPYYREQRILGITINKKIRVPKDYTNDIIGELVYRLKNNIEMDRSLKGKINTLRLNDNPRVFKYINKLSNKLEEQLYNESTY